MKSLVEFIKEYDKKTKNEFFENLPYRWYLYYNDTETEEYLNEVIKHNYVYDSLLSEDYNSRLNFYENFNKLRKTEISEKFITLINESLRSFSIENFLNGLYKKFTELNSDIVSYEIIDSSISDNECGAFKIIFECETKEDYEIFKKFIEKNKDLVDVCKFYRYYISKIVDKFKDIGVTYILFEPLDTKDVTKEIKSKFNGKVYHITDKKYVNSIKKNGLLIASMATKSDYNDPQYFLTKTDIENRNKEIDPTTTRGFIRAIKNYRNFTDRTFVFYTKDEDIKAVGKYVCNKIYHDPKNSVIVEIDLQGHKNPFFRDTLMQDIKDVHFAYSNIDIPAKMISNIIEL